jgi:hypothetical protein
MFIGQTAKTPIATPFEGAGLNLRRQHSRTIPLLRTEPKGFCFSIYKHVTPNGVKLTGKRRESVILVK